MPVSELSRGAIGGLVVYMCPIQEYMPQTSFQALCGCLKFIILFRTVLRRTRVARVTRAACPEDRIITFNETPYLLVRIPITLCIELIRSYKFAPHF